MTDSFRVLVASVPDGERTVVEIWFGFNMVAELRNESIDGVPMIAFYLPEDARSLDFPLDAFTTSFNRALSRLKE